MSTSAKHRGRETRHRSRSRSYSPPPPPARERERREVSSDWRNVRVKEEPLSEPEGRRSHSSSRRDRDHHERDRDRGESGHSRSRDRDRESHRDRRDSSNRDRERVSDRDRDRLPRPIKIKAERSSSRSPPREFARPRPPRREDDRRPHPRDDERSRDDEHSRGDERPRDIKRERDWDNFFNPESSMSRQAVAKTEHNSTKRNQRMEEYGPPPPNPDDDPSAAQVEKEKPNFGLSGKLTEETNTYRGVVIKYSEPPEARKPIKTRWRLYPFKQGESLEVMYIHRQSAYLLGRERKIADIPIDHPSCSKQHAVIQYRLVPYEKPNGMKGRRIRPYIIDLESANGTFVNGKQIAPKRYVELMEKDVLKFGFSSREYVVLHDQSKDDDPSDIEDTVDKSPSPE